MSARMMRDGANMDNFLHTLCPKELEILSIAAEGLNNTAIARKAFCTPGTVHVYLSRIYLKLHHDPTMNHRVDVILQFLAAQEPTRLEESD